MPGLPGKGPLIPSIVALLIGLTVGYLFGINRPSPVSHPVNLQQPAADTQQVAPVVVIEKASVDQVDKKTTANRLDPRSTRQSDEIAVVENETSSIGGSLTAEFIQLAVSQLPQDVLLRYLDTATPFNKQEFQAMSDPVAFAGKVAQLATGQSLGFESPVMSSDMTITNFLVGEEFKEGEALNVIEPKTTRIFSYFELPNYSGSDVLVKWYYTDSNEILSFKRHSINPDSTKNYIWLDNQLGWVAGNYKVEIYSTDESLSLLSSGNYYVSQ